MSERLRGILLTLGAALCFGVMPSIAIGAYDGGGINVLTLQLMRHLVAAVIMLGFSAARGLLRDLPWRTVGKLFLAAMLLFAPHAALYNYSVTQLPVATAALILFLFPIFISVLSALLGREKISPLRFLALFTAFGGLALMMAGGFGALNAIGVICALSAALIYATYSVMIAPWVRELSPFVTNGIVNAASTVTLLLLTLPTGNLLLVPTAQTMFAVLFNSLGIGVIAYSMSYAGLRRLGPVEASAMAMTEPFFAAIASFLLLGQRLSILEMLGGLVLLGAIGAFSVLRTREFAAEEPEEKNHANSG